MIGQSMWFGRDVLMFRSKHPYGPFVDQKDSLYITRIS